MVYYKVLCLIFLLFPVKIIFFAIISLRLCKPVAKLGVQCTIAGVVYIYACEHTHIHGMNVMRVCGVIQGVADLRHFSNFIYTT